MNLLSDRDFRLVALLFIAVAGVAAYINAFDGRWVWDDASSVLLHKHVQEPARLVHASLTGETPSGDLPGAIAGAVLQLYREDQHAFGRGEGNFYRPLLSTTFALDYLLSYQPELFTVPEGARAPEPGVFWFHLQSLLWHIAAALGLFAVLARLGSPRAVQLAVPLIWIVHPLHTEAVAYISGRADMMSGTFLFFGLYFGLCRCGGWRAALSWMLCGLCYGLGLLSKEATLILPAVLALALLIRAYGERAPEQPARALRSLVPVLPTLFVLAAYILLRLSLALGGTGGSGAPDSSFAHRLYETCQSFALYVKLLFLPTGLHMERTLDGVGGLAALCGALLLVLLVAGSVLAFRRGAWRISLGVALFLLCWLPISGVFPLNAPMAEHWMYVPMAGFWLALAEAVSRLPRTHARLALVPAAILFALFTGLTVQRNEDWDNNVRLFQATLRENPNTMRVHYNLAVAFGDLEGNTAGALRHYAAAAKLSGDPASETGMEALLSQAALLVDTAKPAEALQVLQLLGPALKAGAPDWARAEAALCTVRALIGLGRLPEALRVAQSLNAPELQGAVAAFAEGAPISEQLHLPGLVPVVR